jgi:S1-C subfamily serine protease
MSKRSIIVLLTSLAVVGGAAGSGLAKPGSRDTRTAPKIDRDADSVHITMTAGKGRLGVAVLQISEELRKHLGAPADRGVLVDTVRADSPAAHAGLRVGDVIVEVDGDATRSATDVLSAMSDRKKGEAVAIAVVRGGQRSELRATLEDDPGPVWRGAELDKLDPRFRGWFDEDGPAFGELGDAGRRSLDEARRRIEDLERRLEKLEKR